MVQDNQIITKKVYGHYRRRRWDNIFTPEILLQGLYLEKAGFHIGDNVKIDLSNGKIVITKGGQNG